MDDHTDLHIFQTQPCSLGSPCLTDLLQGASCIIRHLVPRSESAGLQTQKAQVTPAKACVPVLIHT